MTAPRPRAFVRELSVSQAELRLQWHDVNRRVTRRRRVRAAVTGGVIAGALALVAALALPSRQPAWGEGSLAEAGPAARPLMLTEGSHVELEPYAAALLEHEGDTEVSVVVRSGRVRFDVAKRPTRRFRVLADAVEVRVVGTGFTVMRNGAHVEIAVTRGIVEVTDGELVRRLEAGDRYVRGAPLAAVEEAAEAPQATAEAAVEAAELPAAPAPADKRPTRVRRKPAPVKPTATAEAPAGPPVAVALATPPASVAQAAPPAEPAYELTPQAVFEAGARARTVGETRAAIRAFQTVTERWPQSAYAPMAAFEWGRLAMDIENDPKQAARAFVRTLELSASQSLVEDALARLTEAYGRFDVAECRRSRADYLRRFPDGPHLKGVNKACPL